MSRSANRGSSLAPIVAGALLLLAVGCSTDSPTAPSQDDNGPGANPIPATRWNISVTADPAEVTVNSSAPITISFRVQRADNGNAPAGGTTIVVSASLGAFGSSAGSGSAVLSLVAGRASVLFFPGSIVGGAVISAQLEDSVGQLTVPVVALIEAVVSFEIYSDVLTLAQFREKQAEKEK